MADPNGLQEQESLPAQLRERSKELGFLHQATRLLHARGEPHDILRAVLELLPSAMCYPELAGARLCLGSLEVQTRDYEPSDLSLRAEFDVEGEGNGLVEVCYAQPPPTLPVFLEEEQSLLGSLAELLRGQFELMRAKTAHQRLLQAEAAKRATVSENSAKDQLLSALARELRFSLQVTLGWIQDLKQGARDPELGARGLQILEQQVTLQSKLVGEMELALRADAGAARNGGTGD